MSAETIQAMIRIALVELNAAAAARTQPEIFLPALAATLLLLNLAVLLEVFIHQLSSNRPGLMFSRSTRAELARHMLFAPPHYP